MRNWIALSAVVGVLAAGAAMATALRFDIQSDNKRQHAERNAALAYWRLFCMGDRIEGLLEDSLVAFETIRVRGREAMHPGEADPLRPGGPLDTLLENARPLLDELQEVAGWPHCDYEIRFEHGYEAMLPHLRPMRDYSRVLIVDARRLTASGRTPEAMGRLATAMRMAGHLTHDGTAISAQQAMIILREATEQAHLILDMGAIDGRAELADALARFRHDDPFGFGMAIRFETSALVLCASRCVGEDAGQRFADSIQALGVVLEANRAKAFAGMDGDALQADVARAVDLYEGLAELWRSGATAERFEDEVLRIRDGDSSHSAAVLLSGYHNYRRAEQETLDFVRGLIQRIGGQG